MSYERYRNLMPLPYPNAAGSDASACQAVASVHLPPANATAEPNSGQPDRERSEASGTGASDKLTGRRFSERSEPQGELGIEGETKRASSHRRSALAEPETKACPTHAQQLAEIERLLRLNDMSCERSLVEIAAEEDDVPLFLRRARA